MPKHRTGPEMADSSPPAPDTQKTEPARRAAITDLSDIALDTKEGRLLFAALAKITTESQRDKTPDEVLAQLEELASEMERDTYELWNHTKIKT